MAYLSTFHGVHKTATSLHLFFPTTSLSQPYKYNLMFLSPICVSVHLDGCKLWGYGYPSKFYPNQIGVRDTPSYSPFLDSNHSSERIQLSNL